MNNCEVRSCLYYILYTNQATSQFLGKEQLRDEICLYYILYTDWATSQLFGNEQLRDEIPSILYTIYRPSFLAVARKWTIVRWGPSVLYTICTDQATLQLFGNEQLRGEVPSVLYTIYRPSYLTVVRKWTMARWGPSVLYTIYRPSYLAVVQKWTTARFECLYI